MNKSISILMAALVMLFSVNGRAIDFALVDAHRQDAIELSQRCREKSLEIGASVRLDEISFIVAIFYKDLISIGFQSGRSGIVGIRDEAYRPVMYCEVSRDEHSLLVLGITSPFWVARGHRRQPAGVGEMALVFKVSNEAIDLVAIVDPEIL